jgi:uncharacterized protein YndB with AHSA1/START domain
MPNSVSLHRVLKAAPEKVYRAFTDSPAIASWLPPYGFLCTVQEMNPVEGGTFRMTFINFSTGNSHSFGGQYLEVKPGKSLKYTDRFDDPNLPGEMITTVSFNNVPVGTEKLKFCRKAFRSKSPQKCVTWAGKRA